MSDLNHVDTVLAAMIKAWPSLRGSRLDCLHDLATASPEFDVRWNEDGSLWVSDEKTTNNYPRKPEDEDADLIRYRSSGGKTARQQIADRLLTLRSNEVKENFNRDNAEEIILAGNRYDPDFKDYPNSYGWENTMPSGGYRLLANVPENADPLWVAAFVELMEELQYFKYPEHKFKSMAESYAKRYQDDLERAKAEAKEVLIRLKGSDKEKIALTQANVQKQIDALIAQAAIQGVKIEASIV
jgi:hypothetical protein